MGNHRSGHRSWGCVAFAGGARPVAAAVVAACALAGCPTVDLGDTPTDINLCNPPGGIDYFTGEIYPNYIRAGDAANGCTRAGGCHNEGGGNALNFRTNPQDDTFNFRQAQVFLNCGTPEMSQLLTKPLKGIDTHGGGDIYQSMSDTQVVTFLGWF